MKRLMVDGKEQDILGRAHHGRRMDSSKVREHQPCGDIFDILVARWCVLQ